MSPLAKQVTSVPAHPMAFIFSSRSRSGHTPLVADLVDDSGPVSQTPAAGKVQPKRGNTAKKNGGSSTSQVSPLTTRARVRQKAGLDKVQEAAVDPIEELETDSEVDRSDTNAKRALWGGDMTTSRKEPGGASVNIISTYTMTFGGKPTQRVPLCRLIPYLRVRNFQNTSVMTEALKRSFETHCYMENGAGFHICPFDETGNYVDVTDADKEKWDNLWRMESEAFDAECRSSHATVQYDWIQDAERCLQVLTSPLIDYKEMIGDDVYEEFEKTRLKSTGNKAWYHANMTAMAAAYILSFAEVTVAKESFHLIEETEEKKQGKSLTAKQKKDMWDLKVKDLCGTWYNAVFKYATIVNPNLGPEFLSTVRELHNSLSRQPKAEREVVYNVGVDRVKAFAADLAEKCLKIIIRAEWTLEDLTDRLDEELTNFNAYFCDVRDTYWEKIWYPVDERQDVEVNIRRAKRIVFRYFVWHKQTVKAPSCFSLWSEPSSTYSMYTEKDNLCRSVPNLTKWELQNSPWWLEQRCADDEIAFVADAEEICWESIKKEEDPYQVAKGKIAEADVVEQTEEAKSLEPTRKLEGLVLDTSRTRKQREAKLKAADEEGGTEGGTPTAKTGETKNPRSGRSSKTKGMTKDQGSKEEKSRKNRRKKDDEEEVGPSTTETVVETAAETAPETAAEAAAETANDATAAATAPAEGRQPKRQKKQKWHDGLFRTDMYMPFNRPVVVVRTSLKITIDTIQANKNKAFKVPVLLVDELKAMCTRIKDRRKHGFVINKKNVSTAADCLYLDMPTGWKLSEEDSSVPNWNVYPEEDELPRKLMVLARQILDDRGCIIIQHPGTLRSTQQIADALDACSEYFKQVIEIYVHNEEVQFEPNRNMKASRFSSHILSALAKIVSVQNDQGAYYSVCTFEIQVYHSKVEVFCKATTEFTIPKLDMDPFDPENSGRDSAMIVNFNGQWISGLNDKGRSKCIGFVKTLLENFTTQGDIVIDLAGGWGPTLFAATNCSRTQSAGDSTKRCKGRRHINISWNQTPAWFTPEKDYRLLVYAEDVAAKLAELPQTPSQTSVQSENEISERMVFIDDEANVDAGSESSSAVTVYLSSDEELFKDD
ncbi:hypothetical protein R1sor_006680 [Riccia sorocarpa]|uniref:Uncharacterized protein n=1 Tax=Riccia sorocarpa TaxID=122646 RepID=A0ABD3HRR4_9MARC